MSKVLYIEDNPHNMRLVRKMLKMGGYDVIEAMTGESGLMTALEERPNLILLDINLPDMDGIEVCQKLRANEDTAWIPVVALTANAMHGDRERFWSRGWMGIYQSPSPAMNYSIRLSSF